MKKTVFQSALVFITSLCLSSCSGVIQPSANFNNPASPRYVGLHTTSNLPDTQRAIQVVSYNVDCCANIKAVKKLLLENSTLANADIICLQEMSQEKVKFLADSLRYNYVYYPCGIHPVSKKDFGPAILSKWPLKDDRKILLPFSEKDKYIKIQKNAVLATALVNGNEILVISLHLGVILSPEQRKEQLLTILRFIPQTFKKCIVAGDFNTYAQMHQKAIKQAFAEFSFIPATENIDWTYKEWFLLNVKTKLDHIFVRGLKIVKAARVLKGGASDHLPLWVECE